MSLDAPSLPLPSTLAPTERVCGWATVTAERAAALASAEGLTRLERCLVKAIHLASSDLRQSLMTRLDPGGLREGSK
jgi:hypothetical protein